MASKWEIQRVDDILKMLRPWLPSKQIDRVARKLSELVAFRSGDDGSGTMAWHFRFTLRHTETGAYAEIFSTAAESTQFADSAFRAGWERFYTGGYEKTFEVTRCIVFKGN